MKKITIIGCGHGGQALAADLSLRGCTVSLYAHPNHPGGINAIAKAKGVTCTGLINGFVPIAKATCDMQTAVTDSEYIFIALPSYTHEAIFMELLPFIKPGQTIVTLAANFASLVCLKLLSRADKLSGIDIIDMASLPYVCRSDNNGSVEILAVKKSLATASIPATAIQKHVQALAPIFPSELVCYRDVLSLGMNITNGIAHPVVTLLNAGRIGQGKDQFYFYRDGITPEIAALMERADAERMRIGKELGLEMYSFLDLAAQYYGQKHESIYQHFRESPAHNILPMCPTSMQHRYVTEDIAGSLVSWYSLGKLVNITSSVLGNIINLASMLNNINYMRTGTNLVHLNLHDKTLAEVKRYVSLGEQPKGLFSVSNDYINPFMQVNYCEVVA